MSLTGPLALRGGENAVAIGTHIVEVRQEGGFELRLRHRLQPGEPPLEVAQRVPADPRRDVAAGRRTRHEQLRAETLGLLARGEPVVVEIELVEALVRSARSRACSRVTPGCGNGPAGSAAGRPAIMAAASAVVTISAFMGELTRPARIRADC